MKFDIRQLDANDADNPRVLAEIETLRKILSTRERPPLTAERLRWVIGSGTTKIYAAITDGQIIGMASLCISIQLQSGKAWGEDLVVLPAYRNHGVGEMLLLKMIYEAGEAGVECLDATSSMVRTSAAKICYALGFQDRPSRLMRLDLTRAGRRPRFGADREPLHVISR